jgi:hypothetical protein
VKCAAQLEGSTVQVTNLGSAVFNDLIVTQVPSGTATIRFLFSFGTFDFSTETIIRFRPCQRGEVQSRVGSEFVACRTCEPGTYSLKPSDEECHECMLGAKCRGGDVLDVKPGYWRQSVDTDEVKECSNADACNGGEGPDCTQRTLDLLF